MASFPDKHARPYVRVDDDAELLEEGPSLLDPRRYAVEARGVVMQDEESYGESLVAVFRDGDNLMLSDSRAGIVALSDLTGGSSSWQDAVFYAGTCEPSLMPGDCAYVDSSGVLRRCDPTNLSTMPAVGVVAFKSGASSATVQVGLLLRAVLSGLTVGPQYVGFDGRPTWVRPTSSAGTPLVAQQVIGVALASNVLSVEPSASMFIDEV